MNIKDRGGRLGKWEPSSFSPFRGGLVGGDERGGENYGPNRFVEKKKESARKEASFKGKISYSKRSSRP